MRIYFDSKANRFRFKQSRDTFLVEEIPLFEPAAKGRFTILKVRKKDISTWDMLDILSGYSNYKIGYAGLKDKNATAVQYLSIDSRDEKRFLKFKSKKIEILDTFKSSQPIKIGDLKGNRFEIVLENVRDLEGIKKSLELIEKTGVPNYFGYQRFGNGSISQAKAFVEGEYFTKNLRMQKMLISIYQSDLFNRWLAKRVSMDKKGLKILEGDILRDGVPTGLLPGNRVRRARGEAGRIEREFDEHIGAKGYRREALYFPKKLSLKESGKNLTLSFELPKGSYATTLLEHLAQKEMNYKGFG